MDHKVLTAYKVRKASLVHKVSKETTVLKVRPAFRVRKA